VGRDRRAVGRGVKSVISYGFASYVSTVLSVTDPVELQRAAIIIRNLRCASASVWTIPELSSHERSRRIHHEARKLAGHCGEGVGRAKWDLVYAHLQALQGYVAQSIEKRLIGALCRRCCGQRSIRLTPD
jgi:hypothetical protein